MLRGQEWWHVRRGEVWASGDARGHEIPLGPVRIES